MSSRSTRTASGGTGPYLRTALLAVGAIVLLGSPARGQADWDRTADHSEGQRLYRAACATCHGVDGRGAPRDHVGFEEELPDFTDCRFAVREPDADWLGVTHLGGPSRSFSAMMPSFSGLLDQDRILLVLGTIRSFCTDERWPRGELNLPRALITEKACPEDELVWEATAAAEGDTEAETALVYEKRFGPVNQVEIKVPVVWRALPTGTGSTDTESGLGDVALGFKRALHHDFSKGRIFSATAEVVLPTGDEDDGQGRGYTVFEPFLTYGQLLPADAFLQLQGGLELPVGEDDAAEEAFLRLALGRTLSFTQFSRAWSPMIEVVAGREFEGGASVEWDLVPQVQVALNNRQHVLANLGVRLPMDDDERPTEILFYILWDWFDGGLLEGW